MPVPSNRIAPDGQSLVRQRLLMPTFDAHQAIADLFVASAFATNFAEQLGQIS